MSTQWVVGVSEGYDTWYWNCETGWHVNINKADVFATQEEAMEACEAMDWSPLPEDPGTRYGVYEKVG